MSLASYSQAFAFLFLRQSAQAMLLFSSCLSYLFLHLCTPFLCFQFIKTLLKEAKQAVCQKGELKTGNSPSHVKMYL